MLICWKLDRLDRKLGAFQMIADVIAAGGRIEFVTQTALNDLSTMAGRISLRRWPTRSRRPRATG